MRPRLRACLVSAAILLLSSVPGWSEVPSRLTVVAGDASPPDATGGRSTSVAVQARGDADNPMSGLRTNIVLQAFTHGPAGMVITEVSPDLLEIEFTNVDSEALDVAGWLLVASNGSADIPVGRVRRVEGPAVLPPGGTLVWSSRTGAVDAFPRLAEPSAFLPSGPNVIELRDAAGRLVDQLLLRSMDSRREALWTGSAPGWTPGSASSLSRVGRFNQHALADWAPTTPGIGTTNPGLVLPWVGPRIPMPIEPDTAALEDGLWEGVVRFDPGAARAWSLRAAVPGHPFWETGPLSMSPMPGLALEFLEGSLHGTEASVGRLARFRIHLPPGLPGGEDRTVSIGFDSPGEFVAPSEILIPAGSGTAEFDVHNLDDDLADGRAVVRLTVSAPGLRPASVALRNDDDESGGAILILPAVAREGAGTLPQRGLLQLPQPAGHDTEFELTAGGRLGSAGRVVVPRNDTTGSFPVWIKDDRFLNLRPEDDEILASTPGWPGVASRIRVMDDEGGGFTLELPSEVNEGASVTGRLSFAHAPSHPVEVDLGPSLPGVLTSNRVILPAGTNELRFVIAIPDDATTDTGVELRLCPRTDRFVADCRWLAVRDNDLAIEKVSIVLEPNQFSSVPAPFTLQITDTAGQTKPVDGMARLRIASSLGDVTLDPGSTEVPVVQGRFDGGIRLLGTGSRTVIEAEFAGIRGSSGPVEVVSGRPVAEPAFDVASWPGRSTLLVLGNRTNEAGVVPVLSEFDPATGGVIRSLDLVRPAWRMAVSDSGAVAWLASTSNTVQRVDLDAWAHMGEVGIAPTNGIRRALVLALSPGSTEDLAVLTGPMPGPNPEPHRVLGIRAGERLPNELLLGPEPHGPGLVPGREPGEFFAVLAKRVHRIRLTAGGVESSAFRDLLQVPVAYVVHPAIVGTNLVFGGGLSLDPETLMDRGGIGSDGGVGTLVAVLPYAERGVVVFANELRVLQAFRIDDGQFVAGIAIPATWSDPVVHRMVRWGATGLALLSWDDRRLLVVDSPLLSPPTADLAITLDVPSTLAWPAGSASPPGVPSVITITNRGPHAASNVRFMVGTDIVSYHENLAAGEALTLQRMFPVPGVGPLDLAVSVASDTFDPDPANSIASAAISVTAPSAPGEAVIDLAARHLAVRPDGTELWAAVGPDPGPEGVVVLDPVTAEPGSVLPVGADPRRVVPSADGRGMYVLLGENRVVHWDLALGRTDLDLAYAGDAVVGIASIAEPRERLAVLLRARLLVLEGTNVIQSITLSASTERHLATHGDQLWLARATELRTYRAGPAGLASLGTFGLSVPSGNPRFTTDGEWAGFEGFLFRPNPVAQVIAPASGAPLVPGPSSWFYNVTGNLLVRHAGPFMQPEALCVVPGLTGSGPLADVVRWGPHGFAFRTATGRILTTRSAAAPVGQADLAVSIHPVATAHYLRPSEFRVVVTNRGPDAVAFSHLGVWQQGAAAITADPPAMTQNEWVRVNTGPIPAGGSAEVRVRVTPDRFPVPVATLTVGAVATGSAADPGLADNNTQVNVYVVLPPGELAVDLRIPDRVEPGSEFVAVCTLSNIGNTAVSRPSIVVDVDPGLAWIGSDKGRADPDCCGQIALYDVEEEIGPGDASEVRLRMRVDRPGLFPVVVRHITPVDDPRWLDNAARVLVHVEPPSGSPLFPGFDVHQPLVQWSPVRQEWIVGDAHGLSLLDPLTLRPRSHLKVFGPSESNSGSLLVNEEGTHVWGWQATPGLTRIDLATGQPDVFIPYSGLGLERWSAATVPGSPDLVVFYGLNPDGGQEVVAYRSETRLSRTYADDLVHHGRPTHIVGAPGERVYISNGGQLRELRVTGEGLELVRNLDAQEQSTDIRMGVSGGLLLRHPFPALDLETLQEVAVGRIDVPVPDGVGYRGVDEEGRPSRIEAFDLAARRVLWRREVRSIPSGTFASAGHAGVLVAGSGGGLIPAPEPRPVAIRARAELLAPVTGIGREFTVRLHLEQDDDWIAGPVRITPDTTEGIEITAPALGGDPRGLEILFETPRMQVDFTVRASRVGDGSVGFTVLPGDGGLPIGDTRATLALRVPPPPVLLVADIEAADNGQPIEFRLSGPAPEELTIGLESELVTAQAEDLESPAIQLVFPPGSDRVLASWIRRDEVVEADEQFRYRIAPGTTPGSAPSATITIRNDDRALLRTTSDNRLEGDPGTGPALVTVALDSPVEVPVEIGFTTVPGTALAGEDFIPLQGRLVFTPDQPGTVIRIPVVGDSRFEPTEMFTLTWWDPRGTAFPRMFTSVTLRNDDAPPAAVAVIGQDPDGRITITVGSQPGVRYNLQTRDLATTGSWSNEGSPLNGTGLPLLFRPALGTNGVRFFRVLSTAN